MKKYNFSIPMPENVSLIDKLGDINKKISKSKINSLYFALPSGCKDSTGFEQLRTNTGGVETTFEDYKKFIDKSNENNFEFIYLLNSPRPLIFESRYLSLQFEKLDKLINNLKKMGCKTYRVCNPMLIAHLEENYPDLKLYVSTSLEYHTLQQYSNFLNIYKNIKEMIPAVDLNKNFKFLINFQKRNPNIKLELIVNEGCMYSCPLRYSHNLSIPFTKDSPKLTFANNYFNKTCTNMTSKNIYFHLANHNIIYPWEIEEYGKIGIYNFKIVGRSSEIFRQGNYIDYYQIYLEGIDDDKKIKDLPITIFNHYFIGKNSINLKTQEARECLPNIQHFKKHGHLCAEECGIECNYCFECAKKLEKI